MPKYTYVCVKETPEVARHVADVRVSGKSVPRCHRACTSGQAYDRDGKMHVGPTVIYVYRDGVDGNSHEIVALRESDVANSGTKDAVINWSSIRSRP